MNDVRISASRNVRRDRTRRIQYDVGEDLVVGHLDVADGDTQTENLLQLELDGRADLSELVLEVLGVRDGRRELASCERTGESGPSQQLNRNIPIERPGTSRRGICLMRASDARKALYYLASFLTSFLFLLSFCKSSTDLYSRSICFARSMSAASARMQMDMLGRGTWGEPVFIARVGAAAKG